MSKLAARDYRVSVHSPVQHSLPGPGTFTVFPGTTGNDKFTGGSGSDTFNMADGGDDTVKGKGGDDIFKFGGAFNANDQIDGGSDSGNPFVGDRDALSLNGNYSSEVVFGAKTMVGVETLNLAGGHDYNLTINDTTIAAADFLTVNASNGFSAGDTVTIDASADTDGTLRYNGGAQADHVTGTATGDTFGFTTGFSSVDRIDGGSGGFDQLILDGDYSDGVTFDADTIRNIDVIYMYGGNDYSLHTHDGNVAAGETLTASGAFLGTDDVFTFDGSDEIDGHLNLYGGAAGDTLTGGAQADYLQGNGGADTLDGGAGPDTYGYAGGSESQGLGYDTVVGADFDGADTFDTAFEVAGTDATAAGKLNEADFDGGLKKALKGKLGADHAILFNATSGDMVGDTFLVIDANGHAGYQAGVDLVILLSDAQNLADFDAADFV